MDAINEKNYPGQFLVSEANGDLSRKEVVIAKGQVLKAATPMGEVTIGGSSASASGVTGTGNGTVTGLAATAIAKIGAYTLLCTVAVANAGTFSVTDPDGILIGNATVGVAFNVNGLSFTINDGSTDFTVGASITVTVSPATVTAGANTGNGVFGAVTVSTGAKAGVTRVVFVEPVTNLGTFEVEGPDGILIGTGFVGTLFSAGGLSFTIADGGTDFVAGDNFLITISAGSGEYRAVVPTARDGSQTAVGLIYDDVDTTTGSKKKTIITRYAEYNESKVNWGTLNDAQKLAVKAQLALRGMIARLGFGLPLGDA